MNAYSTYPKYNNWNQQNSPNNTQSFGANSKATANIPENFSNKAVFYEQKFQEHLANLQKTVEMIKTSKDDRDKGFFVFEAQEILKKMWACLDTKRKFSENETGRFTGGGSAT